jgi:hypothetical protein
LYYAFAIQAHFLPFALAPAWPPTWPFLVLYLVWIWLIE